MIVGLGAGPGVGGGGGVGQQETAGQSAGPVPRGSVTTVTSGSLLTITLLGEIGAPVGLQGPK